MPRVKLKPSPPSCGDAMPTNMVGGNVAQAGGLTSPYPADQTAKYMAALPKSMTQQQKMLSICWQEKCFCCSAVLSFAHCYLSFVQSAVQQKANADVLAHWGLNLLVYLKRNPELAAPLMLKTNILQPIAAHLDNTADIKDSANGFKLPLDKLFWQQYGAPKMAPFNSTLQVAMVDLLGSITETPVGACAFLQDPTLLTVLLLCMRKSEDERFLVSGLNLIVELYHNADDLEITDAQLDKLSASLLDGRVQALLAGVLGSSRCVPLLRSALGLACVLMVEQPWFIFGHMSSELPVPELRNGGRGLVALQEAGIEALAARVLGQQPSGLSYWLAVNFNVMGSHYMEMQAVAIGVLRALLLAAGGAGRPCGTAFLASPAAVQWVQHQGPPLPLTLAEAAHLEERTKASSSSVDIDESASEGAGADSRGAAAASVGAGEGIGVQSASSSSAAAAAYGSLPAGQQAELLIFRMLHGMQAGLSASGICIADMEPKERNATPDWRLAQVQRLRGLAEESAREKAQASASLAVDFLCQAMRTSQI